MDSSASKKTQLMDELTLTDKDYEKVLREHELVIIDYWATWCSPCIALSPVIEELKTEFQNKCGVFSINVDSESIAPSKNKIRSLPTVVLYKNGKELTRFVGVQPKKIYVNEINAQLDGQH